MTEEEKTEEKQEEEKPQETLSQVADRIEKANAQTAELLKKQEDLASRNLLGGNTKYVAEEKPKEESPSEYRKRVEAEVRAGKYND